MFKRRYQIYDRATRKHKRSEELRFRNGGLYKELEAFEKRIRERGEIAVLSAEWNRFAGRWINASKAEIKARLNA